MGLFGDSESSTNQTSVTQPNTGGVDQTQRAKAFTQGNAAFSNILTQGVMFDDATTAVASGGTSLKLSGITNSSVALVNPTFTNTGLSGEQVKAVLSELADRDAAAFKGVTDQLGATSASISDVAKAATAAQTSTERLVAQVMPAVMVGGVLAVGAFILLMFRKKG